MNPTTPALYSSNSRPSRSNPTSSVSAFKNIAAERHGASGLSRYVARDAHQCLSFLTHRDDGACGETAAVEAARSDHAPAQQPPSVGNIFSDERLSPSTIYSLVALCDGDERLLLKLKLKLKMKLELKLKLKLNSPLREHDD